MSKDVHSFTYKNIEIHTRFIEGEYWFVATDIVRAVGAAAKNTTQIIRKLPESSRMLYLHEIPTRPNGIKTWHIDETGLRLLLDWPTKPEAALLLEWVEAEVLPMLHAKEEEEELEAAPSVAKPSENVPMVIPKEEPKEVQEDVLSVRINQSQEQVVSGRMLHTFLGIGTEYAKWFTRICEYGFTEGEDFRVIVKNDEIVKCGRPSTDHELRLDMAKEICMLARNERGKQARQYLEDHEVAPERTCDFIFEGRRIRTLTIDGEPWFVGKDVAEALGYKAPKNALEAHVNDKNKLRHRFTSSGQGRDMYIINESGLYSLIFASKLPKAIAFKEWVTREVLPTIRKHGIYMTPKVAEEAIEDQESFLARAVLVAQGVIDKQKAKIAEQAATIATLEPKAKIYDKVMNTESTCTVSDVAISNGWQSSALFKLLRTNGWLDKRSNAKHHVSRKAPKGVFKVIKGIYGEQIRVTQEGYKQITALIKANE